MRLKLAGVIVGACLQVALGQESRPAIGSKDAWPMFRGNSRLTGVAANPLPDKLEVQWKFEAGDAINSSAAIADGVAYVGCDNGAIYAVHLGDGKLKWRTWTAPSTQSSSSSHPVRAAIQSSPTVYRDLVLFGDQDGVFRAVQRDDGRERWKFTTAGEVISSANCMGDRVLFGSYDGFLYCLDVRDGKLLWRVETEGRVHGTPAVAGDRVMIAGCDAQLRVLQTADGKEISAVDLGGYSGASPAVSGNCVFAGTFSNQVLGVDWSSAKQLWVYENPKRQFPFYSSPAVLDKYVVIGGRDKTLHCLDLKSGKAVWTFPTQGRIDASPVIARDRVFIGSGDGNLYGVDLASGREVWRYQTGSSIAASAGIGEGRLVVGTEEGVLYCFGGRN